MSSAERNFKERLRAGDLLVGTWVKTPSPIVTEVLAGTELDLLCLDAEHAPFDRLVLDGCILAARSRQMPSLVRIPADRPEHILNALDLGATGIVIPHVMDERRAREAVRACLYGPGGRGYAGSSRAANYTRTTMAKHIAASTNSNAIVAQIEDREGVENIPAIAGVEELDCLFIGRADLAVALGVPSSTAPEVIAVSERICDASRAAGKAVGMFVPDLKEVPHWRSRGVSLFLLESDHTFLIRGAQALANAVRAA